MTLRTLPLLFSLAVACRGTADPSTTDVDEDGVFADVDCDDGDPDVGAPTDEICDGVDNDCDGSVDESGATGEATWYADADADSFGDAAASMMACEQPEGYVQDDTDCDDTSADVNPDATETCNGVDDNCDGTTDTDASTPPATWYADGDGDGYGDALTSQESCEAPAGYVLDATDCDDAAADVNPAATESCNSIDDDCDGSVDESGATGEATWYADADADTYGDAETSQLACAQPAGYVSDATDCDDSADAVNPAATESCNSIDDDCDGSVDESGATGEATWYADADADTFGDATTSQLACAQPAGYVVDAMDCDDSANAVNPAATESCNSIDDDCDGSVDESGAAGEATWYADADADTFGDATTSQLACAQPTGYVSDATDCDDSTTAVNPGATESCNSIDDDCDGSVDESGATGESTWYADADADMYGDATTSQLACAQPTGYVSDKTDCDDSTNAVYPGATEVCNSVDDDCDTLVDEAGAQGEPTWYADADSDGFGDAKVTLLGCAAPTGYVSDKTDCDDGSGTVYPGATEVCNDVDDDCNTLVDDGLTFQTYTVDADGDGYGAGSAFPLHCGDVLAQGGTTDGLYTIDPDGSGPGVPFQVYCDQTTDGGGWNLVFDQDINVGPGYRPNSEWMSVSPYTVAVGQYSVLDQLDGFRNQDGSLELRMVWPQQPHSGSVQWTQELNPLTDGGLAGAFTVANMTPANQTYATCGPFSGLVVGTSNALLDVNASNCWWGAIGTQACHSDGICAIPGWYASDIGRGGSTPQAVLFVRSDVTAGDVAATVSACKQPAGYALSTDDCNDAAADVYPTAVEQTCLGVDANCDGLVTSELVSPDGTCVFDSCAAVKAANPSATDGLEWLETANGVAQVMCDQTTDGGGWTFVEATSVATDGVAGWSGNRGTATTTCGGFGTLLGGYGVFGAGAFVERTFDLTGIPHSEVRGVINFVEIDSWDNESARLFLDGQLVWSRAIAYNEGAQVCGAGNAGWNELEVIGSGAIAHTGDTVVMKVDSTIDQGPTDESWGLRSAGIWVR